MANLTDHMQVSVFLDSTILPKVIPNNSIHKAGGWDPMLSTAASATPLIPTTGCERGEASLLIARVRSLNAVLFPRTLPPCTDKRIRLLKSDHIKAINTHTLAMIIALIHYTGVQLMPEKLKKKKKMPQIPYL